MLGKKTHVARIIESNKKKYKQSSVKPLRTYWRREKKATHKLQNHLHRNPRSHNISPNDSFLYCTPKIRLSMWHFPYSWGRSDKFCLARKKNSEAPHNAHVPFLLRKKGLPEIHKILHKKCKRSENRMVRDPISNLGHLLRHGQMQNRGKVQGEREKKST